MLYPELFEGIIILDSFWLLHSLLHMHWYTCTCIYQSDFVGQDL